MVSLTALMGFLLFSGAAAPLVHAQEAERPLFPRYIVTLTAYNAVPEQTDRDHLVTASGAFSNPEVVAARSRDLAEKLPFGTIVEFDGAGISSGRSCGYGVVAPKIGYRVITDTMNARYASRVDILFDTRREYVAADKSMKNAAEVLGICEGATIRVVGFIDIKNIPQTQAELVALVRSADSHDLALK